MALLFTSFTQIMITVHWKKPFNLFEAIINPDCLNFYEFDCLDKYYGKSIIVFKGTVQEKWKWVKLQELIDRLIRVLSDVPVSRNWHNNLSLNRSYSANTQPI